jgi:hypothetical protein
VDLERLRRYADFVQRAQLGRPARALGELPKMEGVAFAYMFSADQELAPAVGAWHPRMLVYAPYYKNPMLGDNEPGDLCPLSQTTRERRSPWSSFPFTA